MLTLEGDENATYVSPPLTLRDQEHDQELTMFCSFLFLLVKRQSLKKRSA